MTGEARTRGLIDTNIVIHLAALGGARLPDEMVISAAALSEWLVGQPLGHAAVVMGVALMTRNPVSAIAAQNSAARPGSPRRCGSASGQQTSVTSIDGTTKRASSPAGTQHSGRGEGQRR